MNNEEILNQAKNIKEFCAVHTTDEESCPFFKGYYEVEKNGFVVICELNKGEYSPCNWNV